jgi:hypothetical protein
LLFHAQRHGWIVQNPGRGQDYSNITQFYHPGVFAHHIKNKVCLKHNMKTLPAILGHPKICMSWKGSLKFPSKAMNLCLTPVLAELLPKLMVIEQSLDQ